MLKKLTSVFAVALVLCFVLGGITAAAPGPGQLTRVGPRTNYSHESGYLKDASKNLGLAEAQLDLSQPPLEKPSASCILDNLSNGVGHFSIGGVIYGAEDYAVFQDPTAECGGAPYSFQVWGVVFPTRAYTGLGTYTFNIRARIYDADLTIPACPVPGALLHEGPIVSKTVTEGRTNVEVNFDQWSPACVDGPYFAAVNFPDFFGSGKLRIYINHNGAGTGVPFVPCASVNYYAPVPGWYDLGASLCCIGYPPPYGDLPGGGVNTVMWSYGFTDPDNECHTPGICVTNLGYHCTQPAGYVTDWYIPTIATEFFYGPGTADPNGIPSTAWFTRFTNATPCTLLSAQVLMKPAGLLGPNPDMNMSIYSVDGAGIPLALLYGPVNFTTAQIFGGGGNFNYVGGNVFGAPVLPIGDFAVVCEPGPATLGNLYDPTGNPGGNAIAFWSDLDGFLPATCTVFQCRSGAAVGAAGNALYYFCDPLLQGAGYGKFEWRIRVSKCCAPPKIEEACTVANDTWPTHAHDYGRTSATKMGVGDPCEIKLKWKGQTTKAFMFFNNVSVHGGKVFCTDDQAVHCFDLDGGALLWTYFDPSGIITAGGMRNNITIAGNRVIITGGVGQSVVCLDTLGGFYWGRYFDSQGGGTGDWLCGQQRFGVSVIAALTPPDSIVVLGDEAGCLWALNVTNGLNYGPWGTNPITPGGIILHSPAYDGSFFYLGTRGGKIYKIDKTNGSFVTLYTEPTSGDGYWSGCSYDATEGMIYAQSTGTSPERVKLSTAGVVQWTAPQGNSLYGTPTIGRKKVYFPQDDATASTAFNPGVLLVAKSNGAAEYNFATNGVNEVPQPVTLTCDNYLFAGDRAGKWHLLDAVTQTTVWTRQFQSAPVYGTALAHHYGTNKDYAVMSIFGDASALGLIGAVFCWELNWGPRPMMDQLVFEVDIGVPLGTGLITGHTEADVIANWAGCNPLTVVEPLPAFNLNPPTSAKITPTVTKVSKEGQRAADAKVERTLGKDYLSLFNDPAKAAKHSLMTGKALTQTEEGLTEFKNRVHFKQSKGQADNLAAGAALLRTQNVFLDAPGPLLGGETRGLIWDYDGNGLERALDVEYVEFQTNDPDFYPEDPLGAVFGYPYMLINYVGGCPFEWYDAMWLNAYDFVHEEQVSNYGAHGDGTGLGLDWADGLNTAPIYDGGFFVFQQGGALFQADFDPNWDRRFLPDPGPISGVCGVDFDYNVPLGRSVINDWFDGGVCPCDPASDLDCQDVLGEITWTSFIDTMEASATTLGLKMTQVEISMYDYDHGYGDLKFYHYRIANRDAVVKNGFYAGLYFDWDVQPDYDANATTLVPEVGGYAIWDSANAGTVAFGHLVLPSFTSLTNSARVDGSQYKLVAGGHNAYHIYPTTCVDCWFTSDATIMTAIVNFSGAYQSPGVPGYGDRHGLIAWPQFNLAASGSTDVYGALIGVDATSNDPLQIQDEIRSIAFRANKFAGFARGDVNDDGKVDAIDVAYLAAAVGGSGAPIYPWGSVGAGNSSNGDVNNNGNTDGLDVTYIFNYLMGGAAPLGAWRFGPIEGI